MFLRRHIDSADNGLAWLILAGIAAVCALLLWALYLRPPQLLMGALLATMLLSGNPMPFPSRVLFIGSLLVLLVWGGFFSSQPDDPLPAPACRVEFPGEAV